MPTDHFVWYELATRDIDAALAFYKPLLGWEAQDFPGASERYAIVSAKGSGIGGVMALPEGMSQCFWMGYVGTPDIEATLRRFTASGGKLQRGPWDIPNVGKIALVTDPHGAGLALIQGASDRKSDSFDPHRPGHCRWNELHTPDPAAACAFYGDVFGWTKGEAIDMGPMGTYQIITADETGIGGIVAARPGMKPNWLFYFGNDDVRGAIPRIADSGGTVLHGPSEVPGGLIMLHAADPQGAAFALVGPA